MPSYKPGGGGILGLGAGTADKVARWTDANTLSTGALSDDGSTVTTTGNLVIGNVAAAAGAYYIGSLGSPAIRMTGASNTLILTNNGASEYGAVLANVIQAGFLGNGQRCSLRGLTELTTIAAAATTDTTIQIPENSILMAVSVRVTVLIPTAASFTYGIAGATARFGTGILVAAGTTSPGTLGSPLHYASATAVRFTPNLTPGDNSGRVRVTIWYFDSTPPTS